jgi:hypothetical protein
MAVDGSSWPDSPRLPLTTVSRLGGALRQSEDRNVIYH